MSNRDHEYTIKLATSAIEKIKALSLPADPPGYQLWYSYAAGANPDLNRAINQRIDAKGKLSVDELDEIYSEYFSPSETQAGLATIGTRVSAEIDSAIAMLDELILSTSRSRDDCTDASSKLAQSTDCDSIRAIADALVRSLRDIELRHTALEQRFNASKRELETLQHKLSEMSIESGSDPLTALANRRRFDRSLEQAVARAEADGSQLSLLMIDIDDFKGFNDRYGHLTGDSVLRLVGSALTQSIKGQDLAARYGGEEFAVLLPNTSMEGAVSVAESLRLRVMRRELKRRSTGERLGVITVSIGVATHRAGERSASFIERADNCLYDAKRAGRNCTKHEGTLVRGDAA
jgi:diguanylate cyclase